MRAPAQIEAVVFDMDGVLVDTEHLWDEVREELTAEWGGRYTPEAQQAMMGMSSNEWSRYLHEVVGLREPPDVINGEVVRRMLARYEVDLPVVPGAVQAVRGLAEAGFRLALASSSNRELIDAVLRELELTGSSRSPCRPRRWRAASRRPTSTSRRRLGSESSRLAVPRSRTRRAGSVQRTLRGCA